MSYPARTEGLVNMVRFGYLEDFDGELLTHLRFASDIEVIAETTNHLQAMVTEPNNQNSASRLKKNCIKIKIILFEDIQQGFLIVRSY